VADVKNEVNRSMELDELKKMKENIEGAARDVESSVQTTSSDFEKTWAETTSLAADVSTTEATGMISFPEYKHPGKNWRLKQGATPQWFKSRSGVRTKALSGAARVARYRPKSSASSSI
jgi:sec-independent protein translocase protein TatB